MTLPNGKHLPYILASDDDYEFNGSALRSTVAGLLDLDVFTIWSSVGEDNEENNEDSNEENNKDKRDFHIVSIGRSNIIIQKKRTSSHLRNKTDVIVKGFNPTTHVSRFVERYMNPRTIVHKIQSLFEADRNKPIMAAVNAELKLDIDTIFHLPTVTSEPNRTFFCAYSTSNNVNWFIKILDLNDPTNKLEALSAIYAKLISEHSKKAKVLFGDIQIAMHDGSMIIATKSHLDDLNFHVNSGASKIVELLRAPIDEKVTDGIELVENF